MNYGIVKDDVITAPMAMRSNFEGIGGWHTLTDAERAVHGWYLCEVLNESVDSFRLSRSELPELAFDGEQITATYTVIEKSLDTIKGELLASLAAYRFSIEVGGLALPGGLQVKTDRESQSQLSNAYITLKHGLIPDTDWKGANDWELVDLALVEPIARAVAVHTRACFRGERLGQALINAAESVDELASVNIAEQFSAAYAAAVAEEAA